MRTRLVASPGGPLRGELTTVKSCGTAKVDLTAGTHRLTTRGTSTIRPVDVVMSAPDERPLGAGDVVVATGHNENSRMGRDHTVRWCDSGRAGRLAARVADQRCGCAGLSETYRPGALYRVLLIVGGLLLVALAVFCLRPGRDERRWAPAGFTESRVPGH